MFYWCLLLTINVFYSNNLKSLGVEADSMKSTLIYKERLRGFVYLCFYNKVRAHPKLKPFFLTLLQSSIYFIFSAKNKISANFFIMSTRVLQYFNSKTKNSIIIFLRYISLNFLILIWFNEFVILSYYNLRISISLRISEIMVIASGQYGEFTVLTVYLNE